MKTQNLSSTQILLFIAYCLLPAFSFSQCPAWTQKSSLTGSSRVGAVGFSIGGKGYMGTGNLNGPLAKDFWEYDTLTNAWTQKADFGGAARMYAVGFSIGNKGYIGTGDDGLFPWYSNDFWEFNPDSNKWFQKADFGGTMRCGAIGFSISGMGYIGTGRDEIDYTNDFWKFDPDSNKWFQIANFPGGTTVYSVGLSIDSLGYLGLGNIGSAFWAYNPTNNSWTQKAYFGGSDRQLAVAFSIDSKGYIGTGDAFGTYSNDFWEYDPVSNSWKAIPLFGGLPRAGAFCFSIGSYGFVGTGTDNDGNLFQDFWKYDPSKAIINISLSSTNATCYSSSNGTATAIATGAYSPFTFSWDNGQTTSTATGLTPGSHSVVVSNSIGCSKNATVNIGVNEEWNVKANFGGLSRYGAVGFSIGEKGYLGTGYDSVSYKKDFWEYNDSNNTWSQRADFGGSGRYYSVGIAISGKGYIGTGIDTSGGYTNDFWEYNPTGNSWLQKSGFPGTARYGAAGFTAGNFGYLGTGKDSSGNKNDFYEYNPGNDSWLTKSNFTGTARYGAVAFSIGTKGYIGTGKDSAYKNDFWTYEPSLDIWTQITPFPASPIYFAVGISSSSYGYVGSGYDGNNFFSDFYSYDTTSNSWSLLPEPQMAGFTGRFGATGFSIGDFIYIGTGFDWDNLYRNDIYSLNPNLVPIVSLVSKTDASCISSADGSASISASNGAPPYTYSWDNGSTSNTASGLAPGTINANVSDSLNCVSAIPINISYLTAPWMQKANFSGTARNSAAGFSIGTKGYIGTGEDGNGWPGYKNDFWEFNPDSNIWSQKADFGGSPRKGAIGFSIGNKGYIGTGKEIDSLGNDVYLNDFWEYNPDSNSWTRKADLTGGARWYAAGFSITGKGYIGTGQYYDFGYINYNDLWEYNPGSDTWISKSFFPGGERYAATGISIGNKGYLGLGYGSGIKNDFWEFDPVADSWTQKANFGGGYQLGASGFALGNKGYVGTGYFNNATDFWEYNTATDVWTRITDFAGSSRYFAVGFSIGSKGYIGTGYSNIAGSSLNDFWEYDPTRDMLISFSQNNVSCTGNSDGSVQVSVTDSYLPLTYQWSNGQTDSAAANLSVGTYTLTVTDSAKCRNIQQYNIAAIAGAWKQKTGIPGNTVAEAVGFSVGGFGYIGDGTYDFGYRPSYFQYNPATNTWSGMQSLYDLSFQERKSAFAFTVGSNAYVGAGESYGNPLSDFYEFSGTWNQKNDLSFFGIQSRWDAVAFAISTKGYMGTGWSLGGPLKDFWEYNPGSDSWAQLADFGGTARSAATGFSVSGKGYIGTGNDGSLYNDFWEYDPVGNAWTQKAPFPGTARSNAVGFSIGTKGYIGTGNDNSYTNDFWEYDPGTDVWTKKSDLAGEPREGAVGFSIGTKGYIGFGKNSIYLSDFWEYDPAQDMSLTTTITNVSCYNDSTGIATASVSSGASPYTYTWSNSQTNSTASELTAGTYYITVSDTSLCSRSDTIIITQPASGISYSTSHQDLQCNGNNNGSVSVAASGGTGTLSYSWSNGITSATNSNLVAANYLLTITDSNGCTKTTTVPVIEPPAITISSTLTNVSCMTGNDGSVNTTASGGAGALIYQWSTGDSVATLSNLTAGNYTLTVTDDSNCVKTSLITVTEPPVLSTSLISDSVNCSGTNTGSINLTPSGGTPAYSYLWSNAAVTQDISSIFSGTYYVTVKDNNLCTKTDSVFVGQPGLLTANVTKTDVSCKGLCDGAATANLTGGTPPYFYSWQTTPPKTTQTASALCPGTYTVNLSDANNCQATPSVTITEPNLLTVVVSSVNPACGISDGTALATPSGGNIPYTFIWSNTATASSITGLSPNTYTVTVTDLRNCDTSASVILTAPSGFPITLSSVDVTCGGLSDGSVNLTTGGGTPPYTFNWNNGSVSEDLSGISGGNYLVTVTDTNNCIEIDSAYVNELAPVTIFKNIIHVLCFGNANGSINTTITGGVFPYLYNWSNGLSMDDITGLDTGIYYLTVTDDSGCTALDTSEITQPQQLTAATGKMDVSCYGFCDGVANVTPSGGTLPYVFVWSDPFAQTNSSATGLCPGSYNVNVSDVNNCQVTPGVTISEPPPLIASVTASDATCNHADGSTEASAGGGTSPYSFFWSNGVSASLNSGLYAATYFVTVTDDKGCDTAATGIVGTTAVTQDICLVTVDSATGKNLVVWEKTAGLGTDYFIIYREDTVLNQYDSIGFVPFDNLSEFVDLGSLPKTHSDRYSVATVDSCGNKSVMSSPHKTMHLAVVYNIDGFTRELLWENYEGFSFGTYSIFRGLTADSIVYVGSVVSTTTQYSDADSVNGADSLFYIVSVIHPAGGCDATMKVKKYNASKSNTAETQAPLITGSGFRIPGSGFNPVVYPNPSFKGKFILAMMAPEKDDYSIEITNAIGQKVFSENLNNFSGNYLQKFDLFEYGGGVYSIHVAGSKVSAVLRVVVL